MIVRQVYLQRVSRSTRDLSQSDCESVEVVKCCTLCEKLHGKGSPSVKSLCRSLAVIESGSTRLHITSYWWPIVLLCLYLVLFPTYHHFLPYVTVCMTLNSPSSWVWQLNVTYEFLFTCTHRIANVSYIFWCMKSRRYQILVKWPTAVPSCSACAARMLLPSGLTVSGVISKWRSVAWPWKS